MVMWTRLLTLVNSLGIIYVAMWTMGVNHMAMWTIGVNHIVMCTRLLTLVPVGDWSKYAQEAIIKLLFYISLFMIKVYYSC